MNTLLVTMFTVVIINTALPLHTVAQDSAEVVILNPNIGDLIDDVEHDYYGIFQSFKYFSSAVIYRMPDGKYIAKVKVIASTGEEVTTMEMPEAIVFHLAEKIENFDELKRGVYMLGSNPPSIIVGNKKVEWDPNAHLAQINHSETKYEQQKINKDIRTTVIALNGEQYTGNILFADESTLVVWKSDHPYKIDSLKELAIPISPSKIERIVLEKEGHFLSRMGTGFLVGGGIGALIGFASGDDKSDFIAFSAGAKALLLGIGFSVPSAIICGIAGAVEGIDDEYRYNGDKEKYMEVLPKLNEISMFSSVLPPEIQIFLSQKKDVVSSLSPDSIAVDSLPSSEQSAPRIHISLNGGKTLSLANNAIIDAFNASGFGGKQNNRMFATSYPVDHTIPFFWNVASEYDITDRLQLGFSLTEFPQLEIQGKNLENEYANGTSYSVLCVYVPVPVTPLLTSRSEFAIAAGISFNSLSVDGTLSKYSSASNQNSASFVVNKQTFGLHIRGSYDFYFSQYFSLQCKVEGNIIPSVDVPAVNYINTLNSEVKTLKAHAVNFSGINLSFGVRCHI